MSDESQIHVRVPNSLKRSLQSAAKWSARSVNAEIVYRLEGSFFKDELAFIGDEIAGGPRLERSLTQNETTFMLMLREMNTPERQALFAVANELAEKAKLYNTVQRLTAEQDD